jgi:hypothetical protein
MTQKVTRLGSVSLLSLFMIVAAEPTSAGGTLAKVGFSGVNSSGAAFSGYFEYDESLPGTSGTFNFDQSPLTHKICEVVGSGACLPFSGNQCTKYQITTSGGGKQTFQLTATVSTTPATTVVIELPMGKTLSQTALPACTDFPATPNPNSTFTLSGATSFSGTITALNICPPAAAVHPELTFPSPQTEPVASYPVYEHAPLASFPAYVCQPRPASCLSRLFCRTSLCIGCR